MAGQRVEPRHTPGQLFLGKKVDENTPKKTALLIEQIFFYFSICGEKQLVEKKSTLLICPTQKFV